MSEGTKIYRYKSVAYVPCPICRNEIFYIYEIRTRKKQDSYFSLNCKKCASEIYYNDLSHIVNNYELTDEHQYRKAAGKGFSFIAVCSIVMALVYIAYNYGNEYYQKYAQIRTYSINYQPLVDNLLVNDFLLFKHPEFEEHRYSMIKILKINHDHILANISERLYKKKEDLIGDIIYNGYGRTETDFYNDVYIIPKTELVGLLNHAVLMHKKLDVV